MRKFLITFFILLAATGGWYIGARTGFPNAKSADQISKSIADEQNQLSRPNTIRGQGKLVPAFGLINIVAAPGERIASMTDKRIGDVVSKGELLVTLNSQLIREKDLELAKARRTDALKNFEFEKQQASFKLKSAQLAVDNANASDERIAEQAAAIGLLRRQRDVAQQALRRLEKLRGNQATKALVNQSDLDKQQLLAEQSDLQVEQAELSVKIAKQEAERAKELARNGLATVEFAVANANDATPLKSLDAAVGLAQQAYEMTQVRSPINNATIIDIIVQEGDSVTNQPIMVLADLAKMNCEAEIVDSYLKLIDVSKNLRSEITGSALPSPLTGTVISKGVLIGSVSLKSPNPFERVDQRTGTVTIQLDNPEMAASFVNLQVDVEIELNTSTNPGDERHMENERR